MRVPTTTIKNPYRILPNTFLKAIDNLSKKYKRGLTNFHCVKDLCRSRMISERHVESHAGKKDKWPKNLTCKNIPKIDQNINCRMFI